MLGNRWRCFNLAIEVLLISSHDNQFMNESPFTVKFQSRNRGSFNFK